MTYNYHRPGSTTPDNRDDFCDETTILTSQDGRLAYEKYSDGDADDSDMDYQEVHNRRNERHLPDSVPDPFFRRRD